MAKTDKFAQFRKGSGVAPDYGTLAPVPASATAKYVQSFDERAIMQEQPPTISGSPRGNPKPDVWPTDGSGERDSRFFPKLIFELDDMRNIRSDNQVLVRETPSSKKADKNVWAKNIYHYTDQAGEDLTR
jgi:hypothetical protein